MAPLRKSAFASLSILAAQSLAAPSAWTEDQLNVKAARQSDAITPCTASSAKCLPYLKQYAGPLLDDFVLADPSILKDGSNYYAYATQHGDAEINVPIAMSSNGLQGTWKPVGDAMPRNSDDGLGEWTVHQHGDSGLWNPDVTRLNSTHFIIYYSAHRKEEPQERCIGVGYSKIPTGPFTPTKKPWYCPPSGGAIGVDAVIDDSTTPPKRYVLFKRGSFGSDGKQLSHLSLWQVDPNNGFDTMGSIHDLTTQEEGSPGEESPAIARMPNNKWLLLHTEGTWAESYRTVYAISKTKDITGEYEDYHDEVLLGSGSSPKGPTMYRAGGPDFIEPSNNKFIFAAEGTEASKARHIYSAEIGYKEA